MAKIETTSAINQIHGKTNGRDRGYFYMRNGKQFYRDRDETYQQNQSPRQKWNSAAFAYASRIRSATERRIRGLQTHCFQREGVFHSSSMEI